MKIAVYGTGAKSELFCKITADNNVEIVYFVETQKTKSEFNGKKVYNIEEISTDEFDKLVIAVASDGEIREYLKSITDKNGNKFDDSQISCYRDWIKYEKEWSDIAKVMPFRSCIVNDDIVFLSDSKDVHIPNELFEEKRTFPEKTILSFFELTEKYYKVNKNGIFFDIGANIGTTCIYVKKKVNSSLNIIGFEPGEKNYDLLRVNCILNHVQIKTENMGLSDISGEKKYMYVDDNSGHGSFLDNTDNNVGKVEVVKSVRLDEYIRDNNIQIDDISYIWMDTEGWEPEIIEGGMQYLSKRKIPLLQELNSSIYIKRGSSEMYINNMNKLYDKFIDVHEYERGTSDKIYDISELREFVMAGNFTDLFFF